MFHEVRILDSKKQIKKIIPVKELSRKYWAEFNQKQGAFTSPQNKMNKQPNN